MKIEVLGTGCAKCKQLEANVHKALLESGKKATVIKVTEIETILSYGVLSTPAIVVDGEIRCAGRLPDVKEIRTWL